jgi:acyl CoA:acetate/3-ketoacid CoA transferase beta subunit
MAGDDYTRTELLVTVASSLLEDKRSAILGTGLPLLAGLLAQKTHAPDLLLIFEAGGFGAQVPRLPISVGDSRTFYRANLASSMHDVMSAGQAGHIDYGFLGAAQIDAYGNLNTTVLGPHDLPHVRLPGSGGAADIGSFAWKTIIIMQQDERRFVFKLDFLTTAGYLDGPSARERAGLPVGTGPYRVITQLGLYDFDQETCRMRLCAVHPGVTVDEALEASSFELLVAPQVAVTAPPTPQQLCIMRELDPTGLILGRRP